MNSNSGCGPYVRRQWCCWPLRSMLPVYCGPRSESAPFNPETTLIFSWWTEILLTISPLPNESRLSCSRESASTALNCSISTNPSGDSRLRYPHQMGKGYPVRADQKLIQIVGAALADVTRRSGHWLVCPPGCTPCCIGGFSLNQLDPFRLRRGLAELEKREPERAARVRQRARDSVARLSPAFPGDPISGVLDEGEAEDKRFAEFANDEPCPALDPLTGNCELYESRPMTCRVFGPPVRSEDGLGVCELCYQGAWDEEIAAWEMKPDPDDLESTLV